MIDMGKKVYSPAKWQDEWLREDYSWRGLLGKKPLDGSAGTQQKFLRDVSNDVSDEEMLHKKILFDCKGIGRYHVCFIPDEWVGTYVNDISLEELCEIRSRVWNNIARKIKGRKYLDFEGFYISQPSLEIIQETSVKLWRARFGCELIKPFANIKQRKYGKCLFEYDVIEHNDYFEGNSFMPEFKGCVFEGDLKFYALGNVGRISVEECEVAGSFVLDSITCRSINIQKSFINKFYVNWTDIEKTAIFVKTEFDYFNIFDSQIMAVVKFDCCRVRDFFGLVSSDFRARVSLSDFSWPLPEVGRASSASSTYFEVVQISGNSPPLVQFFDRAEFQKKLSIGDFSSKILKEHFWREINAKASTNSCSEDNRLLAIAGGCRTLRQIQAREGDIHQEQLWQRAELIARRRSPDCESSERFFSILYGWFADYGISILRPFAWLLGLTVLMGFVYSGVSAPPSLASSISWSEVSEGLGYSLSRALPIGAFQSDSNIWRVELLGNGGEWNSIFLRLGATIHSVVSAALIFFTVMAIRRKFKIS